MGEKPFGTTKMDKQFFITSVCREDVISALGDNYSKDKRREIARSLTDDEMEWIARKMADAYCDCCFWTALRIMAEAIVERR